MLHLAFGDAITLGIKQANMMLLRGPIKADEPANVVCHRSTSNPRRATATFVGPCTGARGANLLLDFVAASAGAQVLPWCSWHGVRMVAPGRSALRQPTMR